MAGNGTFKQLTTEDVEELKAKVIKDVEELKAKMDLDGNVSGLSTSSSSAGSSKHRKFGAFNGFSSYSLTQLYEREIGGKSMPKLDIFAQNNNDALYQRDLKAHTGCVNAVDFSPTEEWIVSGKPISLG